MELFMHLTQRDIYMYEPTESIDGFLDEVINYEVKNIILSNFKKTGTIFRLTSLRDSWNDNVIKKSRTI